MNHCFRCFSIVLFFFLSCMSYLFGQEQTLSTVDTGYELWMNYKPLPESGLKQSAIRYGSHISLPGSRYDEVIREELERALKALLTVTPIFVQDNAVGIQMSFCKDKGLGEEGYIIRSGKKRITLQAYSDAGFLYGTFHLIRLIQCGYPLEQLNIKEIPALEFRMINHWVGLGGTVERGYAGKGLWAWDDLPKKIEPRYTDYARAEASIGINAVILNNVNADPRILGHDYLEKVAALADIFRKYHIKVYLAPNFAAPVKPSTTKDVGKQWGGVGIGHLDTADPLNPEVQKWWMDKVNEIYSLIPDFGGFLVKANSEGMAGPQDYHRSHVDGANMLARALKPHGGIVLWRTFVYNPEIDKDRMKRSYKEFQPLDGQFDENVVLQTKNGTLDFQPSEPAQPLFGAMRHTPLFPELQITQEYLGRSVSLVYLLPMWRKTFLDFDTYCNGKGSTVSNIIAGKTFPSRMLGMAGVGNIGRSRNWTAHHFAQANWYAFGRLAWKHSLSSEQIGEEWLRQTFLPVALQPYNDSVNEISPKERQQLHSQLSLLNSQLLQESREAVVDYMMPLGLHHIFAWGHHYGPEPWCDIPGARPDWMPSYYHRADDGGIGFDRSSKGSNATAQYHSPLCEQLDNVDTCPENLLLWFHHVPWNHRMKSGRTLWAELCYAYDRGVQETRNFQKLWAPMEKYIDPERFRDVQHRLKIQARDAVWWKDACLLYFQQFSKQPIPYELERPVHELKDMMEYKLNITNFECPPYGFTK